MENLGHAERKLIESFKVERSDLEKHIGRKVKYKNPTCIIEHETFMVRHIQYNYKKELCYNLVVITGESANSLSAEFGRACSPSRVYFVED